jgi:hypothetical protein
MAIWAAGPPKAVIPNLRNNAASPVNLCDNGDFIFAPFYSKGHEIVEPFSILNQKSVPKTKVFRNLGKFSISPVFILHFQR